MKNLKMKKEFKVIADLLPNNSRVLDIGCGDGSLMHLLKIEKNIEVRGLELSQDNVQECIYKGLPVIQGNAETELHQFPDKSFDYVVLSQTLQAFYEPEKVLKNVQPKNGLAVARMVGHISYLSEKGMQEKFGRKLQEKADYEFSFNADFQVESYLRHQGSSFVERFDANSVLYITRAMDYFDLSKQYKGGLVEAFKNQLTKFLVISFSSDWLYTTKENKDIVIALNASGADVSYSEIETDKGHDSFLLNEPEFLKTLKGFIDSMYEKFKK